MNYLVVDIGGTNTRFAFFRNKKLVEKRKYKTTKDNRLLIMLLSEVSSIQKKFNVKKFDGLCISAPGYLEPEKLKLTAPTNIPKIKNLSLVPLKRFTKKFILVNDGDCAVIGAHSLEKKDKSVKNIACLTLGTGFGCGLILNGELYKGKGTGSEYGHTTIDINGKKDMSGNYGCVENYVSIRGLKSLAKKKGFDNGIRDLIKMCEKGNKKALSVYDEFSKYVSTAIVNISNTLDLDVIYLTGGLMHGKKFFFNKAVNDARKRIFKGINPKIKATKENLSILGGLELLRN